MTSHGPQCYVLYLYLLCSACWGLTPLLIPVTLTCGEAGGGEVELQSLEASLGLMEWGHTQQCSQLTLELLTVDSGFVLRVCSWLCMNLGTICRVGD